MAVNNALEAARQSGFWGFLAHPAIITILSNAMNSADNPNLPANPGNSLIIQQIQRVHNSAIGEANSNDED